MILVFLFLGIIIILLKIINDVLNVKVEIEKLHISNIGEKLNVDFALNIGVYFFNKIKIVKYIIDKYKISDLIKSEKLNINKLKQNNSTNKEIIKSIKRENFVIEDISLEGYFGTFDTVLSACIYGLINSIVPIVIAKKIEGKYTNNIEFLNTNENKININLKCIISIKMVNIINILYFLKKKGGRNNGKSSNRRTYAYSNE